ASGDTIPGALSILKGAVPGRARGFGHMAPTYFRREPGIDSPTAIAAPHFIGGTVHVFDVELLRRRDAWHRGCESSPAFRTVVAGRDGASCERGRRISFRPEGPYPTGGIGVARRNAGCHPLCRGGVHRSTAVPDQDRTWCGCVRVLANEKRNQPGAVDAKARAQRCTACIAG